MLSKRELKTIKSALPVNGYKLISEKSGVTVETVRKVLNEPSRYREDVIKNALCVIEEKKVHIQTLKEQIKTITS